MMRQRPDARGVASGVGSATGFDDVLQQTHDERRAEVDQLGGLHGYLWGKMESNAGHYQGDG